MARLAGKVFALSPKNVAEGIGVCQTLVRHGIPATLGKFSVAGDDPAEIVDEYCRASESAQLVFPGRFYLSVKAPALGYRIEHVKAIALVALKNGQAVHFDSHGYDTVDPTLDLLDGLMRQLPASTPSRCFGLTIPSRWKRSNADAEWAAERGIRVRLVKGEFPSARAHETDPSEGFLRLAEKLACLTPDITVATHDVQLARKALERLRGSAPASQLELLYGFPVSRMMALGRKMGVVVGFYVPYGETLLLYAVRHLLANPHKLLRSSPLEMIGGSGAKLARIIGAG